MFRTFNTQVGTNKEQSEKLVALGLDPNTADLTLTNTGMLYTFPYEETKNFFISNKSILTNVFECKPSWSIDRLLELMPDSINNKYETFVLSKDEAYYRKFETESDGNIYEHFQGSECSFKNRYDALVNLIEWLIKNNLFNNDYLVN